MTFLNDLRFALRSLVRVKGLAVTVVLTLALGIGATTAIFTVVNAVLLRPLPFRDAGRLVEVRISRTPHLSDIRAGHLLRGSTL